MPWDIVHRVRRNHALEHATIAVLAQRPDTTGVPVGGNSTAGGFYLYGNIATKAVAEAVQEALARLRQGERDLAVSPFCGTNFVVGALLGTVGAALALGRRDHLKRLPNAVLAVLGALIVAQPAGKLVQQHWTTLAEVEELEVVKVRRLGWMGRTVHRVRTRRAEGQNHSS